MPRKNYFQSGITFTSSKILKYAIILLGFSMNLFEIFRIGGQSLLIIVSTISTSLIISYIVSKLMNIPSNVSILIGVGSSICGGSAIAATSPVIDADNEDITKAISVIFLFNVIAAFSQKYSLGLFYFSYLLLLLIQYLILILTLQRL